jgi:hypothetical protein
MQPTTTNTCRTCNTIHFADKTRQAFSAPPLVAATTCRGAMLRSGLAADALEDALPMGCASE